MYASRESPRQGAASPPEVARHVTRSALGSLEEVLCGLDCLRPGRPALAGRPAWTGFARSGRSDSQRGMGTPKPTRTMHATMASPAGHLESAATLPILACMHRRLKIVVSPVRVWVSPFDKAPLLRGLVPFGARGPQRRCYVNSRLGARSSALGPCAAPWSCSRGVAGNDDDDPVVRNPTSPRNPTRVDSSPQTLLRDLKR